MNLIKTLDDELNQMHLTDFEKARYIYLRCCEIFSFDSRWFYTDIRRDEKTHLEILNKKFNLENIDSDLVICHSFSKYILKPLIDYFTSLECEHVNNGGHSFVRIKSKNSSCSYQEWDLDATLGDMKLVKLDLPTKGFRCNVPEYDRLLDEIDLDLGFCSLNGDYYENLSRGNSITDSIENIGRVIRDSKACNHFSDASYLYDLYILPYSDDRYVYFDKNYNFHKLVDVCGEYSFYDFSKENGSYQLRKIRPSEYKDLSNSFYKSDE